MLGHGRRADDFAHAVSSQRSGAAPAAYAQARAVVCGAHANDYSPAATICALKERLPLLAYVIIVGEKHSDAHIFGELLTRGQAGPIDNPPDAADPAFICFSSGTSASLKSVVHGYRNMLANNRLCAPMYGLRQVDVIVSRPPFTHGIGICYINLTLFVGATQALFPAIKPDVYCRAIEQFRPTVLLTAPAHVAACRKARLLERGDFSSLRIVGISGAPCPPTVAEVFQRTAGSKSDSFGAVPAHSIGFRGDQGSGMSGTKATGRIGRSRT